MAVSRASGGRFCGLIVLLLILLSAGFAALVAALFGNHANVLGHVDAIKAGCLGLITRLGRSGIASHVVTVKKGLQLMVAALEHGKYLIGRPVVHVDGSHRRGLYTIGTMTATALKAN